MSVNKFFEKTIDGFSTEEIDASRINHDELNNFVSNEHIDWTNTTNDITITNGSINLFTDTNADDVVDHKYEFTTDNVSGDLELIHRDFTNAPIVIESPMFEYKQLTRSLTLPTDVRVNDTLNIGTSTNNIKGLGAGASEGVLITSDNVTFGGVRFGPTDQGCFPELDNLKNLGGTNFRWVAVYAVNGTIQTSGTSKKKKIKDIKDDPNYKNFILGVKPKAYQYIEDDEKDPLRYGVLAEEVEQLSNDTGFSFRGLYKEDGVYGINYSEFIMPMLQLLQEQEERIKSLESKKP